MDTYVFIKLKRLQASHCPFKTPQDVGRLSLKILSGFSGFTADQWHSWVTIFSPVALREILPANHLRCWLLYVRACSLLFTRIITRDAIEQVDQSIPCVILSTVCVSVWCQILYTKHAPSFTFKRLSSKLWASAWVLVLWIRALQWHNGPLPYKQSIYRNSVDEKVSKRTAYSCF